MDTQNLQNLKVSELKQKLKDLGESTAGVKAELLERLKNALASQDDKNAEENAEIDITETTGEEAEKVAPPPSSTTSTVDLLEKKKQRAERFGTPLVETEEEKKRKRAERFGLPEPEESKKAKRAERFGLPLEPRKVDKGPLTSRAFKGLGEIPKTQQQRMKKANGGKAANFSTIALSPEEQARMEKRAQRFATAK